MRCGVGQVVDDQRRERHTLEWLEKDGANVEELVDGAFS
jgi:hypothetical protein